MDKIGSLQLLGWGSGYEPLLSMDIKPTKIYKNHKSGSGKLLRRGPGFEPLLSNNTHPPKNKNIKNIENNKKI